MATRELSGPPSILPLYAKAALPMIPGASMLPFVPGSGKDLPELDLVMPEVTFDVKSLAAYNRVCGFTLRDEVPSTYIHVLAFPLHMALMGEPDFPFGAVGLVHVNNTITQHRPVSMSETLSIKVTASKLRPHAKGKQFDMVAQAKVGRTIVWEGVSTYLRLGQGDPSLKQAHEKLEDPPVTATWRLEGGLGRRYAGTSGDRNPIHLYDLTAKPLGFNKAIIHGMWTKARCLAALESVLPDAYKVDVQFRRPIPLPSKVTFGEAITPAGIRFAVRNARDGAPHLDGTVVQVAAKKR
ncbi:MAG TPA: MaoC/PaaZ C-terminal domain-containing protein [Gemmatimonadaceae bacterium]|nr:MaoC/PaaZ C-terminal domain-containing protein [Gemmatimonadaceae bacterium]